MSLPSALDAVDKPIGLPPSILKKAEEVRLDSGPERIETSINDVQALAKHNATLLDEVSLPTSETDTVLSGAYAQRAFSPWIRSIKKQTKTRTSARAIPTRSAPFHMKLTGN